MTEVSKPNTYQVQSGDTLWKVSQKTGKSVAEIKTANPDIKNDVIKIGQKLSLGKISANVAPQKNGTVTSEASIFSTPKTTSSLQLSQSPINKIGSEIMTLKKYENNQPEEITKLKSLIKNKEGKKEDVYIAPDGKSTIAFGHLLINKPEFLLNIEKEKLSPSEKNEKLKKALQNQQNQVLFKQSLSKDLADAVKTTNIKDVAITVNNNLKLTDSQMNLLLNSDIKKAQNKMERLIGKDTLKNRTSNQKLVILDVLYNSGNAPKFIEHFKNGDMKKAQAELDIFRANGEVYGGLIRRNVERMRLLTPDGSISEKAQAKVLKAYNEYCLKHSKQIAYNFKQVEKRLKV